MDEGAWELVCTIELEGVDETGFEVGVTKMVEVAGGDGSHSCKICFMCWEKV